MIPILIALALTLTGASLMYSTQGRYDREGRAVYGVLLLACGGIALLYLLLMFPINHLEVSKGIAQHEATRATVERARQGALQIEDAALQLQVIEANRWLAGIQYENATVWGPWVPDAIMDVEPIR